LTERQKPLTRKSLHGLLSRCDGRVVMEMVGGIDSGVYFKFTGLVPNPPPADGGRIVHGRILGWRGFCSEELVPTRDELRGRGGFEHGQAKFFARCEERRERFRKWLDEYYGAPGGQEFKRP
jgi:hypothetical protein